jgi:hypothetical protein
LGKKKTVRGEKNGRPPVSSFESTYARIAVDDTDVALTTFISPTLSSDE